jgi:cytochrome P450
VFAISDPADIKLVLKDFARSSWYDAAAFDPEHDNMFTQKNETIHRQQRKRTQRAFSGSGMEDTTNKINDAISCLVKILQSSDNQIVDFPRIITGNMVRLLAVLTFGEVNNICCLQSLALI